MEKQKVFCIGNPAIPNDRLTWDLADSLAIDGVEFETCSSPEELFETDQDPLIIMDVAEGIDEIKLIDDISKLKTDRLISLHDFDLATFLKLMEGLGKLPTLKIIAIPIDMSQAEAEAKLSDLLPIDL